MAIDLKPLWNFADPVQSEQRFRAALATASGDDALNRIDEALETQAGLEREHAAAGAPSVHVFAELELLYRAKGDEPRARHYAGLKQSASR